MEIWGLDEPVWASRGVLEGFLGGVGDHIISLSLDMAALVAQASSCNRSLTFPTAPTQGGLLH